MPKNQSDGCIVVSKCLLGEKCRYDGGDNFSAALALYCRGKQVTAICPESEGGLGTPRTPAEIRTENGHTVVVTADGGDVTAEFCRGAQLSLAKAAEAGAKLAVLKESSPSCGVHTVYDGTFSGRKVAGCGITAALFKENGIEVLSEKDI